MTLKYWFNCFGFHRIVRVGLCLLSGSVLYKCACGSHASAAKYQEFTILLNFFLLVIKESPFFPQWEENQIYILGAFSAYLVYSFAIYFPILCRRQKSPPDLEESVVCLWQREVVKVTCYCTGPQISQGIVTEETKEGLTSIIVRGRRWELGKAQSQREISNSFYLRLSQQTINLGLIMFYLIWFQSLKQSWAMPIAGPTIKVGGRQWNRDRQDINLLGASSGFIILIWSLCLWGSFFSISLFPHTYTFMVLYSFSYQPILNLEHSHWIRI